MNQNEAATRELRLELFGGPRLFRGESVVPLSPQEALLMGLLGAFGPEGALRAVFYEFLWSTGNGNALKLRFGQLLHILRGKLPSGDAIVQVDGRLLLNRQRISSDLEEWESALTRGDLLKSLSILERGFFSGLRGAPTHTLGEWIHRSQADLGLRFHQALATAVSAAESRADFPCLAELSSVQLRMDQDDEEALRRTMRAHAVIDQLPVATAAFVGFSARKRQLDSAWVPDASTTELLKNLSSLRSSPCLPYRGIVGRSAEIRELTEIGRRRGPERPRLVLIQAPTGGGKSSLLRAVIPGWRLDGHPTLGAFSSPELRTPYAVLHQLEADGALSLGAPLLPPLLPDAPLARALSRLSELVRSIASRSQPPIVIVDDADLADDSSLRVLEWALRGSLRNDIILVCTSGPGACSRERLMPLLKADPNYHHISLRPLSSELAETVVATIAPAAETGRIAEVVQLAGGNPLLLTRLSQQLVGSHQSFTTIPQPVIDLLLSYLQHAPRWTPHVLAALSIKDVSWTIPLLSRCLRIGADPLQISVRYLGDHGIVSHDGRGLLIAIAAYEELVRHTDELGLSAIKCRVASFLSEEGYPAEVLVHAWGNAGDPDRAMDQAALAAEAAGMRGDIHSRVGYLRYGLEHSSGTDRHFQFQVLLGTALFLAREVNEAIPILEEACEEAFRRGSREVWLQLQLRLIDARGHIDGAAPRATAIRLEKFMETCTQANALLESAHALDRILHYHHRAGNEEGVAEAFTRAEGLLHLAEMEEVRARTHATLAMRTYYGDPLGGLTHAREAVRWSEGSTDRSLRLHTLNRLLAVLLATGRLRSPAERAVVAEALDLAGSDGDLLQRSHVLINLAVWEADCRNWETSAEKFRQLIPLVRPAQDKRPLVLALCNLGLVLVRSGQLSDAEEVLKEGHDLLQHWESQEVRAQFDAGLGWLALESGRIGLAGDFFAKLMAIELPKSADLTTITLFKCHYLRRKGMLEKALALFDATIRETQPRFPVHAVALICARALFRGRHSNHEQWLVDREWAIVQTRKLHLSEWALEL